MLINALQFETFLRNAPSLPLYATYGEEAFLKQTITQNMKVYAKRQTVEQTIRLFGDALDEETLYTHLYASDLCGTKSLIILDFQNTVPTPAIQQALIAYLQQKTILHLLLVHFGELESKTTKSKWFTACEKAGVIIRLKTLSLDQLKRWIIERGKRYHLNILPDAADELASHTEGHLTGAATAIEKLVILYPKGTIDAVTLSALLADECRFNIFQFADQVIAGQIPRALKILASLKAHAEEPALILWSLARALRIAAQQKPQYLMHLKATSAIDQMIKGTLPGDPYDALQLFCLRFLNGPCYVS